MSIRPSALKCKGKMRKATITLATLSDDASGNPVLTLDVKGLSSDATLEYQLGARPASKSPQEGPGSEHADTDR
jgi:hypothetical protein